MPELRLRRQSLEPAQSRAACQREDEPDAVLEVAEARCSVVLGAPYRRRVAVDGEWDAVFAAIKRCHEVVHALGAPRISSSLRFGTRTDRPQTMDDKVRSVDEKLAR